MAVKERPRGSRGSPYGRLARLLAKVQDAATSDLFNPAEETDVDTLRDLGIPDSVLDFYVDYAPLEPLTFGDASLLDVSRLLEENQNYHPGAEIHEVGFLVVAGNRRGDLYCLDLGEGRDEDPPRVVLVPHDVETGARDRALIERQTLPVAETFEEFLLMLARGGPTG